MYKNKDRGKVFTPDYLVEDILNQGSYVKGNIRKKHVIDNSCGNGQFMVRIVDRYCRDFLSFDTNLKLLKIELETYIHAIEIEESELNVCINRCNDCVRTYGVDFVNWDFICADTLQIEKFNGKMDFCLGNPPYVRVHNLNNLSLVKTFYFGDIGMTDLYIVFYEIGLKMLNDRGILCYITPSSFFTSIAGSKLRRYLKDNNLLNSVCDMKHYQAFDATTYTAIICLKKSKKDRFVDYYEFDEKSLSSIFSEKLDLNDCVIGEKFYFSNAKKLLFLKSIINNFCESDIYVKNGYATLADDVFIADFNFASDFTIPVLKASRGVWSKIFFPYNSRCELIPENEIEKNENLYKYLLKFKKKLLNRSLEKKDEKNWYSFGRSQGIADTYKNKISINTIIKKISDLKITKVPSGSGVYGGLYIFSETIPYDKIIQALQTEEFIDYVFLLGKYKNGGYYSFSSKDVKCYLNYKLGEKGLFLC